MQDLLVDKNQFFQLLSLSDKVRLDELKIIPTIAVPFLWITVVNKEEESMYAKNILYREVSPT